MIIIQILLGSSIACVIASLIPDADEAKIPTKMRMLIPLPQTPSFVIFSPIQTVNIAPAVKINTTPIPITQVGT